MKPFICILFAATFLVACSGKGATDASSGTESGNDSDNNSKGNTQTSPYTCKAALEDVIAYLNQEKVAYICKDTHWVVYDNPEVLSRFEEMPACTSSDKVAVAIERTGRFTVVCHDRDWFFE